MTILKRKQRLDGFIVSYTFNCMDSFYVRFNPEKLDLYMILAGTKYFMDRLLTML